MINLLALCCVFAEGFDFGLKRMPKGSTFPAARLGGPYNLSTYSLGGKIQ